MLKKFYLVLGLTAVFVSCNLFRKEKPTYDWGTYEGVDTIIDINTADNIEEWTGPKEILYKNYRASETKKWDLEYTHLDLKFDFVNRTVLGKANIGLHPHWYETDTLILDAQSMRIQSVDQEINSKSPDALLPKPKWHYKDSQHLMVVFAKKYNKNERVNLTIEYTAMPYQSESRGSMAISGDRGLYFINHDAKNPTKPRQIWSQGETESNSHWFPTIDAPNQKMSQKIALTVPDTMVTLSNGTLIKSEQLPNNLRKDFWSQDQVHAPYLAMIAIGNWAVVKDNWRGKPVNYLVEKEFENNAKMIFGNTPKMIEFFSNYTGVDYPWDKYSQVVVRDFISGAMENTTATVHMEELQHTAAEHLDETYEDYISHELFHQWFGDYATTESWSNITLNESFATYGEYLWREHFYGKDNAEQLLDEIRKQYKTGGAGEGKTLVRHEYENDGELFDYISYQKGACILHMLRNEIGEDAFKAGIKLYLTKRAYQSAEVADLRMAFEEVTGRDLNWFFNQWYYDVDHPEIQYSFWNDVDGNVYLNIFQKQNQRNTFSLPLKIEYSIENTTIKKDIFITTRSTNILLGKSMPEYFIPDANNNILADYMMAPKDIVQTTAMIKMLHEGMKKTSSKAVAFHLFEMACKLADVNGLDENHSDLVATFSECFKTAAYSQYDHTVARALTFSNAHPEFALFGSRGLGYTGVTPIVENRSLSFGTRITALYALYYLSAPADTLLKYTKDSSIQVSIAAMELLREPIFWLPYARITGIFDSRSKVAGAWANKMVAGGDAEFDEVLFTLAQNSNVKTKDYLNLVKSIFYYVGEDRQVVVSEKLAEKLNTNNKTGHLKILLYQIQNEIEKADAMLKEPELDGEYREILTVKKQNLRGILSKYPELK
ncbi:MAG: M1 family metallopeptidase [Bacteroidia bacterium]|nr:M1 family metallopeptidase [Bacteroidia bacterium]